MYFLPSNPRCNPTPTINTTPCHGGSPCTSHLTPSDYVGYSGPNLPCTEIHPCDNLTVALQKIDEQICDLKQTVVSLQQQINSLTTTTTTSTSSTTTSTSSTTTTTSTSSTTTTTTTLGPCTEYTVSNSVGGLLYFSATVCGGSSPEIFPISFGGSYTGCFVTGSVLADPGLVVAAIAPCVAPTTTTTTTTIIL